jgi:hypothetical protein
VSKKSTGARYFFYIESQDLAPHTKIKTKICEMMRQGINSAVRFTTYTTLKQSVQIEPHGSDPT